MDRFEKNFTMAQVFDELDNVGRFLIGTREAYEIERESKHIPVYACREGIERLSGIMAALTDSFPLLITDDSDEPRVIHDASGEAVLLFPYAEDNI